MSLNTLPKEIFEKITEFVGKKEICPFYINTLTLSRKITIQGDMYHLEKIYRNTGWITRDDIITEEKINNIRDRLNIYFELSDKELLVDWIMDELTTDYIDSNRYFYDEHQDWKVETTFNICEIGCTTKSKKETKIDIRNKLKYLGKIKKPVSE